MLGGWQKSLVCSVPVYDAIELTYEITCDEIAHVLDERALVE